MREWGVQRAGLNQCGRAFGVYRSAREFRNMETGEREAMRG